MSLVKSFTQMTEAERKELIKKAFEAKLQLQQELEATKKQMEEKDKEMQRMQEKVAFCVALHPKKIAIIF
jgi:aprataxin and PNK-like factor